MLTEPKREEKKVEYLELIYDLIFVYIIGRNNSLLHTVENGFVPAYQFAAYIFATLAVIQIWNFSTFYTNMFGRNSWRDHIFMFVNMYLLYFIGKRTTLGRNGFQAPYNIAWALILANIGLQYLIELRHHAENEDTQSMIRRMAFILFGEAFLVIAALFVPPAFTMVPILFGVLMTFLSAREKRGEILDFPHLTERAMLYVVFTFGEMIIGMTVYFEGELTWNTIYFSLMGFLIVAGLFLAYELFYNKIVNREMKTSGMRYMLIHMVLIFAMNNMTNALEFMQDSSVALLPKTLFLIGAFLLYYISLFALLRYSRKDPGSQKKFSAPIVGVCIVFAVLMIILREKMYSNIAVSVIFVYALFARIYQNSR